MEIEVKIEKPEYAKTTKIPKYEAAIVYFPNGFKWIPTYEQIVEILHKMAKCEAINKELRALYEVNENLL